mgnify:CR=1 FL=1
MIFSSLEFLLFFSIFLILIKCFKSYQREIIILTSFIFYSFWSPIFSFLLLYLCLSNYLFIKYDIKLKYSISISLIPLFYFKYSLFFISLLNLEFLEKYAYVDNLPLAISFITFTAISTIIDTKLKKHDEKLTIKNFTEFLVYFPQLIAGPILRVKQLIPQLKNRIVIEKSNIRFGLILFTVGFVKKIFLADSIAGYIDPFFASSETNPDNIIKCFLLFPLQIYFDFSGYVDMALGASTILGINLPQNFDKPYLSKSLTEFWRNWHITLSSWFRDYLYIPLGGSRNSKTNLFFNLILVMSVAGLWHGASLNFILWGFLNGLILFSEKVIGKFLNIPSFIKILLTCFIIFNLWIVFRINEFSQLITFIVEFYSNLYRLFLLENLLILFILIAGVISQKFDNFYQIKRLSHNVPLYIILPFFMIIILTGLGVNSGSSEKFIYFEF